MLAINAVSCERQMFQLNFLPFLVSTFWRRKVPDWKTAVWFFAVCSKQSFLSCSVKTIDGSWCCSHQAATVQHFSFQFSELPAIRMLWETWRWSFAQIVAVIHCGRFITAKSVLCFKSGGKVKSDSPISRLLWILLESIWPKIKVVSIIIVA